MEREEIGRDLASGTLLHSYTQAHSASMKLIPREDSAYISLLVSGYTASISLEKVGEVKKGDRMLVTAAAGGTGQFTVQLAKLARCHMIGTGSTDEKVDFSALSGAINRSTTRRRT